MSDFETILPVDSSDSIVDTARPNKSPKWVKGDIH